LVAGFSFAKKWAALFLSPSFEARVHGAVKAEPQMNNVFRAGTLFNIDAPHIMRTDNRVRALSSRRKKEISMFAKNLLIVSLATTLLAGTAVTASAKTWAQNHPRRVEVNSRLANQNRRIDRDEAQGKITAQQAAQLHQDDHQIRNSERTDASLDNTHITRFDQRSLNQNENAVSRDIRQDAH
jgi:hypothetical protein